MFKYSIKYLNYCIKNHKIALAQSVPNEDNHKVKLFSLESPLSRQLRIKKAIGKCIYDKKQMRKLEAKIGRSLSDITDKR